eukprot:CAMPEP_0119342142 /NCGR_PEP_ID=MMETSP1333-20130426/104100_1 /TAXON_ID=418940 /ORGANISM="Scyphosphaera apsteinii, Strain RCC1455" /LENGTH=167 /DNA_ID=CAMNT_0007354301 /DNA_START=92 /DNA_END=595 /DNA_ORIENTATION=-
MYQSSILLLTTATGGIFFCEFDSMDAQQAAVFVSGVVLSLLGLLLLSSGSGSVESGDHPVVVEEAALEDEGKEEEHRSSQALIRRSGSWAQEHSCRRRASSVLVAPAWVGLGLLVLEAREETADRRGRERAWSLTPSILVRSAPGCREEANLPRRRAISEVARPFPF